MTGHNSLGRQICPTCRRFTEPAFEICPICSKDYMGLFSLYQEILREKPQYRTLTPPELFKKLWEAYQKVTG